MLVRIQPWAVRWNEKISHPLGGAVRVGLPIWLSVVATTFAQSLGAQTPVVLDSNALGPIRACAPLSVVNRVFPSARDTVIRGEDNSPWPAKVVSLDSSTWLTVESSWADTLHVWTIRTNSSRFHTRRGYRVGMRLGNLIAKGEHFTAEIAEGQLGLTLVSEGIGVGIDARSAAQFPDDWPAGQDATTRLNPDAIITVLAAGGSCPH